MVDRWWQDKPGERYWLEATDREDIGADLKAPDADASGHDNWRYTLFKETPPGDVVFHYDSRQRAIVGWSRVSRRWEPEPIVWAARGASARERHAQPVEQPGYRVPLSGFTRLAQPVTLAHLRAAKEAMASLVAAEKAAGNHPLYFPFELGKRPLRPMQGYAFKLPGSFLGLFPELAAARVAIAGQAANGVNSKRTSPGADENTAIPRDDDAINDLEPGSDDPRRSTYIIGKRYARDPEVRSAVLVRARGKCEYCGAQGFLREDGTRYLETHHIIALAHDGPDRKSNVIALCSNDHREAHFGRRGPKMEKVMTTIVRDAELGK